MKKAVAYLTPYLEAEKSEKKRTAGKVLLATVKGDVHDIGKNIIGVVLACNNYEVIDLGVMVSADKILNEAIAHDVDIIGLSGLITPSLDEMIHVAEEMQRRSLTLPLLIGGATTSRVHTAVKIEQAYTHGVIHVNDASRAVPVAGKLNSTEKNAFLESIKVEYEKVRENYANSLGKQQYITLDQARKSKFEIGWENYAPATPIKMGVHTVEGSIGVLRNYIDWTPFFHTWELKGHYPKILDSEVVGAQAQSLLDDANALLDKLAANKTLKMKGVYGLFPANADGDDVVVYSSDDHQAQIAIIRTLRQQKKKNENEQYVAMADFIALKSSGITDYIGAFAVTAGLGIEPLLSALEEDHDDYGSILLKAVADRLAEAFAEYLHEKVRTEFWGYAPDETLRNEDLIKEKYQGIRPAPGYPGCPDHLEKLTIWSLLDVEKNTGITLTESLAMHPASSVSGFYYAHPEAHYFGLGKIGEDQVEDIAQRKSVPREEMTKWLRPIIAE